MGLADSEEMNKKRFGAEVRRLRKLAGFPDQKIFAEKAGCGYTTLQAIENGDGNPELKSLETVASSLKRRLEIFLTTDDEIKLLDMFAQADDRNRGLILGYIEGLLARHQTQTPPRSLKPGK